MPGFLLDTNVLSEIRRVRPHVGLANWISSSSNEDLFVPAVVIGEIQRGVELARRNDPAKAAQIESWLEELLATLQVIAMDAEMFREWARILPAKPNALEDAMIAATARVCGLTVATRNVADFKPFRVPLFNPFDHKA